MPFYLIGYAHPYHFSVKSTLLRVLKKKGLLPFALTVMQPQEHWVLCPVHGPQRCYRGEPRNQCPVVTWNVRHGHGEEETCCYDEQVETVTAEELPPRREEEEAEEEEEALLLYLEDVDDYAWEEDEQEP